MPRLIRPQQPVLVKTVPVDPAWVHEVKHDGYRILAFRDGERTRLVSRNNKDWTGPFVAIASEMGAISRDAIIDGEVAAPDENGVTRLCQLHKMPIAYYAFDLLWLEGEDLRPLPLLERKKRLRRLLKPLAGCILYSDHIKGPDGQALYERAVSMGCEGIVSKRLDAPYGGKKTWRKIKPAEVRARQAEAVRSRHRGRTGL